MRCLSLSSFTFNVIFIPFLYLKIDVFIAGICSLNISKNTEYAMTISLSIIHLCAPAHSVNSTLAHTPVYHVKYA